MSDHHHAVLNAGKTSKTKACPECKSEISFHDADGMTWFHHVKTPCAYFKTAGVPALQALLEVEMLDPSSKGFFNV